MPTRTCSPRPLGHDRTSPPLRRAAAAVLVTPCFRVYKSYLLEARVIIATYNDHVGLLSPKPVGWIQHHQLGEPALSCNRLHSNPIVSRRTGGHGAGVLFAVLVRNRRRLDSGTVNRLNYRNFPRTTVIDPAGSVYMPSGAAEIVMFLSSAGVLQYCTRATDRTNE
jgi:hypothetical protein